MKKRWDLVGSILLVILAVTLFILTIGITFDRQHKEYEMFRLELYEMINSNDLEQYNIDKLNHYVNEYMRESENVGGFPIKSYSISGFNLYLKNKDYDFWYNIKFIFKEGCK